MDDFPSSPHSRQIEGRQRGTSSRPGYTTRRASCASFRTSDNPNVRLGPAPASPIRSQRRAVFMFTMIARTRSAQPQGVRYPAEPAGGAPKHPGFPGITGVAFPHGAPAYTYGRSVWQAKLRLAAVPASSISRVGVRHQIQVAGCHHPLVQQETAHGDFVWFPSMIRLHTIAQPPRRPNGTSLPFPIGRLSLLWILSRRS